MSTPSLASLLIQETKAAIYAKGLAIANLLGLPVSSWQAGDPTRSQFHLESEMLSSLESVVAGYIASGFLDYAHGEWLKICAKQFFNVDVPSATFATTDVVLTNGGGGYYPDIIAGDITVKSTISGKTYRNTTGGTLAAGPATTLTITVVADDAGSASSAGAGEIDDLVTSLLGVTCTNPTAAVGVDEQDEATTRTQCRDKLGSFSPNGPKEAYSYVARNASLTGTSDVTRVRVYSDSATGDVTVYIAGAGGAVSAPVLALVEAAILQWATPLCITPTVLSATNVVVPVPYTLWIYKSCNKTAAEVAADVQTALEGMFVGRPIGGDFANVGDTSGKLYASLIESTIKGVFDEAFRVSVSTPDTALGVGDVAALGTVTPTVILVVDP